MSGKSTSIPGPPSRPRPDLGCACATLRRAGRLVTRLYSEEMGDVIEPAQFALLSALERVPGASQTGLGAALGLDKSTLSRNLRLLQRKGWLEPAIGGEDQRQRGFRLTESGSRVLAETTPAWRRAQARLRASLPAGDWEGMFELIDRVSAAALAQ